MTRLCVSSKAVRETNAAVKRSWEGAKRATNLPHIKKENQGGGNDGRVSFLFCRRKYNDVYRQKNTLLRREKAEKKECAKCQRAEAKKREHAEARRKEEGREK